MQRKRLLAAAAAIAILGGTAALAQSTVSGGNGPAAGHFGRLHHVQMRDPAFIKDMCIERFARSAGRLAYLQAKLDLTAAQKPLWDKWAETTASGDATMRDDCLAAVPAAGAEASALDREARIEKLLSAKLDALKSSRPALEALYQSLTPEQRAAFDHRGWMSRGSWDGWRRHDHSQGSETAPL